MRRLVLVGICAALLAAGAAVLLLFLRPRPPVDSGLQTLLPAVDSALAAGSLATAKDLLATVRSLPPGERDQLRLLKRAFQVGRVDGDFASLARLSARALAMNGGSERIRAAAAYASLRTGKLAEAERILGRAAAGRDGQEAMRGRRWCVPVPRGWAPTP